MSVSLTTNWLLIGYNFDLFLVLILLGNWKNLTPLVFLWVHLHYPHRTILRGVNCFSVILIQVKLWTALTWLCLFLGVGECREGFAVSPKLALNYILW